MLQSVMHGDKRNDSYNLKLNCISLWDNEMDSLTWALTGSSPKYINPLGTSHTEKSFLFYAVSYFSFHTVTNPRGALYI